MRFSKINIILLALSFSHISYAQTWEEYLMNKMERSYAALDIKIGICRSERAPLQKITDDWFVNLSKGDKFIVATYLEYLADKECYGEELKNYESDLLAYTAETKDQTALNEWFRSAKVYRSDHFENAFKELDISSVLYWYESKGKVHPFSKVKFLKNYSEFRQ